MKNQKGLTLVALVVTIIVLIILAGISINLILGDNGIITIAKKAKENTELAKIQEETELNELYYQLETEGSNSENLPYDTMIKLTEFKTAIANAIEEAGGIKPDTTSETAIFANNIKGIVKEVTKDATATAEDIAKGKTAWIDGEKVTGINENKGIYMTMGMIGETNTATGRALCILINDGKVSNKYIYQTSLESNKELDLFDLGILSISHNGANWKITANNSVKYSNGLGNDNTIKSLNVGESVTWTTGNGACYSFIL